MKALLVLLAGAALALPPNFAALKKRSRLGLNRSLMHTKTDRVKTVEDVFLELTRTVTMPFLQTKITDMHNSMKSCVGDFMTQDTKDNRIEFESMVEACVGHDYSIMLRFYQEMNQYAKEMVKNDMKCILSQGICKRRIGECLEFLQLVNDFIDMDYDMDVTLKSARKTLGRRFGRNWFDRVLNLTEPQVDQFNLVNKLLKDEKEFMQQYLAEQYRTWKDRHGVEYVPEVQEEEDEEEDTAEATHHAYDEARQELEDEDHMDEEHAEDVDPHAHDSYTAENYA